jgi:peroxiredoxin Q/BCP
MGTHLQVGDKAPPFSGKDQDGVKRSLKEYKGKKLILYFYPQDDTPACTTQACNLRDHYTSLQETGFEILGISPDDSSSHQKFRLKYNLPFPLIADTGHAIIEAFGVWGEKNLYGRKYLGLHRTTFVIDENGIIQKIIKKPRTKMHAEEILK